MKDWKEEKISEFLFKMIETYESHGDKLVYSKEELDKFVKEYNLLDLDYGEKSALLLYNNGYINKKKFKERIRFLLQETDDVLDYIDWLEENGIVSIIANQVQQTNIKKEGGNWYFYAFDGWTYFTDYIKTDNDYRDEVPRLILSGEGSELFDCDPSNYTVFSYVDIEDKTLNILINMLNKMREDFEIDQEEIDNVNSLSGVYQVSKDYDIDELKLSLEASYCDAQRFADENEAYEALTNEIVEHFGLTTDGLEWVNYNKNNKSEDTLKFKFKSSSHAFETMLMIFKIDNQNWDECEDCYIQYSSPYYGWNGDADKYIDEEIYNRIYEDIDNKYLP